MNYIIDFKQDTSAEDIQAYFVEHACTMLKEYDHFEQVYLVSAATAPVKTTIIESIIDDSSTAIQLLGTTIEANNYCAQPNPNLPSITISTTDDKDWWKNYVLLTPDFESETVSLSRKGDPSRVYIMDSGIDATHPEFADTNITQLFSFTEDNQDTNGHGTAIASVVAGKTCGLSSANIQVVKVFDDTNETRQSDLLNGLDAILNDFVHNSSGLGILNISWAIDKNEYIESKIRTLIAAGIYVVASAGNNGVPVDSVTPASMPEVMTIGSFNKELTPSNFSNYTKSEISVTQNETNTGELDGWGPGEDIWVAIPGGKYGYAAGTSIAAAIQVCALAYNFGEYFFEGELLVTSRNRDLQYIRGMSLGHKDLLHLSDPKYANSVNRFTTVLNSKALDHYVQSTEIGVVFTVGKPYTVSIFNPQITKTVEFDTLPYGFEITPNGLLIGDAVLADGITHETHTANMTVTGLDDAVVSVVVTIGIVASDFDTTSLPPNDPIVKMTLNETSCRFGGCGDDCEYYNGGYTVCVNNGDKNQPSCYCS